jgi:HprK-related kinase A
MPRSVKLGDLSTSQIRSRLAAAGLCVRTGPVVNRIRSPLPAVAEAVALHYAAHPLEADEDFADFSVLVRRPHGLRRWYRPQVVFEIDETTPFAPLPGDQGFPMLEWGLNWCITNHCHQYLTLHAAVVERDGLALILPAPPGSGKSTLCAGLAHRGWRLLSDELTVLERPALEVLPVPRPVSLKNASIDVIRRFAPEARFSRVVRDTNKGSVAHFRPPPSAVERAAERARPAWIVLPRWIAGSPSTLTPLPRARAMMKLVENAFNYNVHGARGFEVLAALVDRCEAYEFVYSDLEDAATLFARLPPPAGKR